jgi:PAS domain S-box-containing protein
MIKSALSFLQKRLQDTSRRSDLDFEDSPFGVVFVEAKTGLFRRVNGVFANLMGRSADQLVGAQWSDLAPLALQKKPVYAVHGLGHSRPSPDTWVQSFLSEHGKSIVAEVSCLSSMRDSQDELLWIYIVKDLADKIDAQTQLRVSEQRHRVVADSARDVIWSMSALGEVTYVSPAVEKLRGVTPAEAMKMPLHETLTPQSAEVSIAYFQQVAKSLQLGKTPDSFQGELEYFRKDGSTFWTECLSFPLMDDKGNLVEIVGVTRDISERKHYEDRLLQDRKQAEVANSFKNRLMSQIGLAVQASVKDFLPHLSPTEPSPCGGDESNSSSLQKAQKSATFLLSLAQDILDLTRLENRDLVLLRERFQLSDVLETLDLLWAQDGPVPKRSVTTKVASGVSHHYLGDSPRLVQALVNLLWVAVQSSDSGSLVLQVVHLDRDRDFENLLFTVQSQAFEPDWHGQKNDDSQSQDRSGLVEQHKTTDWQLALCKQLALRMGGDLQTQPDVDGRTVWGLKLRLQASNAGVDRTPEALVRSWPGSRILVVDDHRSIRDIVKHVLEMSQVTVDAAENGRMALQMLESTTYDLVLMDLQMPVMGGIDATRLIRKQARFHNLPIVALSATGDDDALDRWKSEGITGHLAKPFDSERLWSVVQQHLSAKKVKSSS